MSGSNPSPTPAPSIPESPPARSSGGLRAGSDGALTVDQAIAQLRAGRGDAPPGGPPAAPAAAPGAEPAAPPARAEVDPLDPHLTPQGEDAGDPADPAEPDDGAGDDAEPDQITLTHRGEAKTYTSAEVIRFAEQGLDYTQKTQALAEQHRELEQRLTRVGEVMPLLEALIAEAQQPPPATGFRELSRDEYRLLLQTDPIGAARYRGELEMHREDMAERARGFSERKAKAAEVWSAEQKRLLDEHMVAAHAETVKRIPAWADEGRRSAMQKELVTFAAAKGFTQEEIAGLRDPRMLEVLLLAAQQQRALERLPRPEATPAAPPRNGAGPRLQMPGRQNMGHALGEVRRAEERLGKEGSIDAAVALRRAQRNLMQQRGRRGA